MNEMPHYEYDMLVKMMDIEEQVLNKKIKSSK